MAARFTATPARSRRRPVAVLAAAVVAALAVGGGVALARTGPAGPSYRLATAKVGDVEQDLVSVGTVSATRRASVSFPVSGTVASVPARLGATVGAGDVLATLSTTALDQQVADAEAALATARQAIAADEASRSGSTTATLSSTSTTADAVLTAAITGTPPATNGGSGRGTGAAGSGSGAAGSGSGTLTAATAAVSTAQHRLSQAQAAVDRDLAAAENALQACAAGLSGTSGSPTPSAGPSPTASPSPSASPSGSAGPGAPTSPGRSAGPTASPSGGAPAGDSVADCLAAIRNTPSKVQIGSDRAAVAAAEAGLNTATRNLTAAARSATSSSGGKGAGTSSGSAGGTGSTQRGSNNQSGGSQQGSTGNQQAGSQQTGRAAGATGPASDEKLAADRAQIDAAEADLVLARRNVAAAVLTSPIAGTVAAVSIEKGQAVSATSGSITVIGTGQEQVSTTVSLADVELMKVGDPATVAVDGIATALAGRVSAIGLLNTTTGTSTSYPVTVLLSATTARLYDGSGASVAIRVADVKGVLTVPGSAVQTTGRLSTVTVLRSGKAVPARVTVGAVGSDRTEVRSGLAAGDQVVLATLGTPLPSGNSTTNRRLTGGFTGGGGAFGGAAFGGGTGRPGG